MPSVYQGVEKANPDCCTHRFPRHAEWQNESLALGINFDPVKGRRCKWIGPIHERRLARTPASVNYSAASLSRSRSLACRVHISA